MAKSISIPTKSIQQDLVYKVIGEREIMLTFLPPTKAVYPKAPVFFEITGGGWHSGSRINMIGFSKIAGDCLRKRGWAVVSTDYRMIEQDPDVTIDGIVSDVMDAARYITKYEDALSIDPNKIVVNGHSAGSHLAMMLAFAPHELFKEDSMLDNDFEIMGCVPFSGVSMLYPGGDCDAPMQFDSNYIYKNKTYDKEAAYRCSPYEYITGKTVPTLFIHGSKDPLVHVDNSVLAYHKGIRCGANFELIIGQNGGHCLESLVCGEPVYPTFDTAQWIIPAWIQKTFGI